MGDARKSETLQERSDEAARRSPHGKRTPVAEINIPIRKAQKNHRQILKFQGVCIQSERVTRMVTPLVISFPKQQQYSAQFFLHKLLHSEKLPVMSQYLVQC